MTLHRMDPTVAYDLSEGSGMNLAAYYSETYLPRLVAKGVKPATIDDYTHVVRQAPGEPTAESVTAWLAGMKCPPGTRNRKRRYILAILRDARRHGLVGDWIDDIPRAIESQRLPRAWTVQEFGLLLAACPAIDEHYDGIRADLWWRSFLLTLWTTGCRVFTLLGTASDDLDLQTGTLVVASPKDRRQILYRLPQYAVDAIGLIYWHRPLVWPWPFVDRRKTLLRRVRHLISLAGLPQLRTPFHAIRRSVASYIALNEGVHAAAEALDHCRSEITRRYYVDPRIAPPEHSIGKIIPVPPLQTKPPRMDTRLAS